MHDISASNSELAKLIAATVEAAVSRALAAALQPRQPQQSQPHKMLSKKEAAAYLGIGIKGLQRLIKKKRLRYNKSTVGRSGRVRFKQADLDNYIATTAIPARY
jgi:excisionase family DNA binding protein